MRPVALAMLLAAAAPACIDFESADREYCVANPAACAAADSGMPDAGVDGGVDGGIDGGPPDRGPAARAFNSGGQRAQLGLDGGTRWTLFTSTGQATGVGAGRARLPDGGGPTHSPGVLGGY